MPNITFSFILTPLISSSVNVCRLRPISERLRYICAMWPNTRNGHTNTHDTRMCIVYYIQLDSRTTRHCVDLCLCNSYDPLCNIKVLCLHSKDANSGLIFNSIHLNCVATACVFYMRYALFLSGCMCQERKLVREAAYQRRYDDTVSIQTQTPFTMMCCYTRAYRQHFNFIFNCFLYNFSRLTFSRSISLLLVAISLLLPTIFTWFGTKNRDSIVATYVRSNSS